MPTTQVNSSLLTSHPKSQNPTLDSNTLCTDQKQLFTNQVICNQKSDNISAQERSLDGCNYSAHKSQDVAAGLSGMGDSFVRYGDQNYRNDNQYPALQHNKVEHYHNQNSWPPGQNYPQVNQKSVIYPASQNIDPYNSMPSQNQVAPVTMPTTDSKNNIQSVYQSTPYMPQHNNYPGSYSVGSNVRGTSYSGMQISPATRQTQEEPLSSGPPRTNVLGIIPYTTVSIIIFFVNKKVNFISKNTKTYLIFNIR